MVVHTIIRSLPDMLNILALLLIVNFIFCVVGVDMFGDGVPQYFGSIDRAMFTLFVVMTQDGWVSIYREMEDEGLALLASIFFVLYIIVVRCGCRCGPTCAEALALPVSENRWVHRER